MSYKVIPIDKFKKEAKRLVRKYPSLKQELIELSVLLTENPILGTSLGSNTYKIRVAIKSIETKIANSWLRKARLPCCTDRKQCF